MGGGTESPPQPPPRGEGPSPRGRGHPKSRMLELLLLGAIPAWAGAPAPARILRRVSRGHPRVGGGTQQKPRHTLHPEGPSPRGRGHRRATPQAPLRPRAIPAWAGAPLAFISNNERFSGHPRVGGGTGIPEEEARKWPGPSPRGRGHLHWVTSAALIVRAIPAWAGAPQSVDQPQFLSEGHPRVGGGTSDEGRGGGGCVGPSPRGRGHRGVTVTKEAPPGAIPAWAGAPCDDCGGREGWRGHPRVGGGTSRSSAKI